MFFYLIVSSLFNFQQYFPLSVVSAAAFLLYLRLAASNWFSKRWTHLSILIVISALPHSLIDNRSVLFSIYMLIFTICFDGWCIQDKLGARNAPGQKFDKKSESAHQVLHKYYLPTTVYDKTQHNLRLDVHFSDTIHPKINTWRVRAQVEDIKGKARAKKITQDYAHSNKFQSQRHKTEHNIV